LIIFNIDTFLLIIIAFKYLEIYKFIYESK
jgi:hypothetical protein